jgi:hypothetical protein
MHASQTQIVRFRYNGLDYGPDYVVRSDGKYFRRLKSTHKSGPLKGRRKWKAGPVHLREDGYEFWYPKNPVTGKHHPGIPAHRAVLESFTPKETSIEKFVAAHRVGTKRSDKSLGACDWKDQRGNRQDRVEAGTHSTYGTSPGKLSATDVKELLVGWQAGMRNKSFWAKKLGCKCQNISYHLRKLEMAPGHPMDPANSNL